MDETFAKSCDLVEKDMLDILWSCMDFLELIEVNRDKYLNEYSEMPLENFHHIISNLETFKEEFFELLDEIDAHKEVTLLRIKNHIDDRTKLIIQKHRDDPDNAPQPKIVKHYIQIEEQVHDPNFEITEKLPHFSIEGKPSDEEIDLEDEEAGDGVEEAEELEGEGLEDHEGEQHEGEHHEGKHQEGEHHDEEHHGGEEQRRLKGRTFSEMSGKFRFLNAGRRYSGLHSQYHPDKKRVRKTGLSMKDNYRKWLGNLKSIQDIGKAKYKNIHTQYTKNKKK